MTQSKAQLLKTLEAQAAAKRENRLRSFVPYAKQIEFCGATKDHSEVVLQAGNQLGKSEIGAFMAATFATGIYPDWWEGRRFPGPTRGWATGESTVAVRDVSQRKLCGPPGDASMLGTGMIPKHLIAGTILGHGAGGAYDTVKVKHVSGGVSEISFKSYDQDRSKWQGATLDWLWCDEEPPVEHYMEGLARLVATGGLAFSTFTPLNGLNLILPRFRERTVEAMRDRIVIRMRMQDAGHLADEARQAALIATFPGHQRRARIEGLPMLGSGAVFEDVELDSLLDPLRIVGRDIVHNTLGPIDVRGWAFLWSIDFGIDHPFAAVLLGHDRDHDIVTVLAELKIKGGVPAMHASRMKAIAINAKVAWPHDGTQRDKGSGEQLAAIYRREGLDMLPSHATFETGGYSTEAGIMEMLTRMRDGRFKITPGCIEWQDEFAGYHRKDGLVVKTNDDLMSATRVGVMALRHARPIALGGQKVARNASVRMAENVNLSAADLFYRGD
jgi:phage terminase large subunit-like protein